MLPKKDLSKKRKIIVKTAKNLKVLQKNKTKKRNLKIKKNDNQKNQGKKINRNTKIIKPPENKVKKKVRAKKQVNIRNRAQNKIKNNPTNNLNKPTNNLKKSTNNLKKKKQSIDIKQAYPKVRRIIAIGDIHGDLSVLLKSLSIAKVINFDYKKNDINKVDLNKIRWTGKDTYVVQIGDQIDRLRDKDDIFQDEGSDLKILNLLKKLNDQASKAGGKVICIYGNHELMNFDHDFRYVSPEEFKEFIGFCNKDPNCNNNTPGYAERIEAFKRGGILAKQMSKTHKTIVCIGSWCFVHAGITEKLANKYTIKDINDSFTNWVMGQSDNRIKELYFSDDDTLSPVWNRQLSDEEDWKGPKSFFSTINNLNEKNKSDLKTKLKCMAVGHTPQCFSNRGINSACNYRLWRIDAGMSRAFGKVDENTRRIQILEIMNDNKVKILHE